MPEELLRVGEVIEASTAGFTAQCYELFRTPPLGGLVRTVKDHAGCELYGIVYNVLTASLEPGRRPIARGKDETSEEGIYQSNPQLAHLLSSEFNVLVVGHKQGDKVLQYLPPAPARIHSFVYACSTDEAKAFGQSFNFLNIIMNTALPVPASELTAACLRQMAASQDDKRAFLVAAGKELAAMLSDDFNQLKAILKRIQA